MNARPLLLIAIGILLVAACAPRPATPAVDVVGTTVAAMAFDLMTQTAAAATPTSAPTDTPAPTPTDTPNPEATVTPEHGYPITVNFAGCWFGPGPTYILESNIAKGKRVEPLGRGSVSGWYIIRNPYFHRPCWMSENDLKFDEGINLEALPIMTPGVPGMGQ